MALIDLVLGGLVIFGVVMWARWDDARTWHATLKSYRLTLPPGLTVADVTNWLTHVVATTHAAGIAAMHLPQALGLEVSADENGITHTLLVPEKMVGAVMAGLRATLPAAITASRP